jgi:DNA repair protein SbcC/Rad50
MHITKIELENIKSHAESTYEFKPGTIAITGENGAGKTTLIEAVAWTLFDLLDYKKADFVRRGAKKGSARVTFESGLDEREYVVYRDTGTGYYVYDPRLKMRIAEKKEEVCRFLWQHLGVEPGTDLDSLFRRAIGVPQGTFTAVFLETAAERKKAFDKLLKVEEYRRGADELLKTSRYIEQSVAAVRERIARAEGELAMIDAYETEHKAAAEHAQKLAGELADLDKALAEKQELVAKFDASEAEVRRLKSELDRISSELMRAELVVSQSETNLKLAREAAEVIDRTRADFDKHIAVVGRLSELERERGAREKLGLQLANVDAAIANVLNDKKRASDDMERALSAHGRIASLADACLEEVRLAKEIDGLKHYLAKGRAVEQQIKSLDEKIGRLRESYRVNQSQIAAAAERAVAANGLETLQQRDSEIVRQIAHLQASLERDQRFQAEINNGLCPILSQKCLNLKEGETLETFVTSQFTELKQQITVLETEHVTVRATLKTSREAEKAAATLDTLKQRETEIAAEGKSLRDEKDALSATLADFSDVEATLATSETLLKALNNPNATVALLEKEAANESDLRDRISKIESNIERLQSDRRIIVEQLESYKDLDAELAKANELRDATSAAHREYIANEAAAKTLDERTAAFDSARQNLAALSGSAAAARKMHDDAEAGYDRDRHSSERGHLLNLQTLRAETRAIHESTKQRADALAAEVKRLAAIRDSLIGEFREKERLEKVAEVTTFIRDTLKDAAPLVARNYVHHVSLEANQMFREISGNAERTLKWSEDYGIFLEENGHDRPFLNLSGGEQMAASLSVRLALLKQLTDIRIAFFDEPTTNMDAERRENLAMEIGKIKHFDQLFVISHDDTFEGYLDHEIRIGGS